MEEPILNSHNKSEWEPAHTTEHILNQTMVRMFGCPRSRNAHIERKKSKCDYILDSCPTEDQVAAIKDGRLAFSETYNGYSKSDCCHIASATKSIVGLLIGIAPRENFFAANAEEHVHFTIDKAPKGKFWFADPQGIGTPGYGLCMSAEELCRIGQMCLQKGVYEGKRLISEQWIEEMTTGREVEGTMFRGMSYGYLWWIIHPETGVYAAIGNSGNVLYVNPMANAVVAVTSFFKPSVLDRIDFIENSIMKESFFH